MSGPTGALEALLAATHLVVPDDVARAIDDHARAIGATGASLHLVDLDQRWLVPLHTDGSMGLPIAVDGTLAGRCYRSLSMVETVDGGTRSLWAPILDGTQRLGVLRFEVPVATDVDRELVLGYSGLVAELVMTKSAYGDLFEVARRRRPISVAAELLWQLLPPLTFATEDLVVTAALTPTGDIGGDAFDYGVDARTADVAIFDGLGHGLDAGLMATTAVAAYRNARRSGFDLPGAARHIGDAVGGQFGPSKFVTGVLLSLDRASGRLSWCIAGHPPPLLLRHGHVVKTLDADTGMPFGVGPSSSVLHEQLEPGDRILLHTDGVTEARPPGGEFFGVARLTDFVAHHGDDPLPEMMRRLVHAIEDHNAGAVRDDATVVVVEWRGDGPAGLVVDPTPAG